MVYTPVLGTGAARCVGSSPTSRTNQGLCFFARVAELVDALDSKSSGRKLVWVRVPPLVQYNTFLNFGTIPSPFTVMERMYSPWREVYMDSFKDEKPKATAGGSVFANIPPEEDEARYVLHRGTHCFIIMNLYPYNCGHLMVIPYRQTAELSDLDRDARLEVMDLTELSVAALRMALRPQGFNIGANLGRVSGGSVDTHLHFHIVPRWEGDTNFMPVLSSTKVLSNDMRATWKKLKAAFAALTAGKSDGSGSGSGSGDGCCGSCGCGCGSGSDTDPGTVEA